MEHPGLEDSHKNSLQFSGSKNFWHDLHCSRLRERKIDSSFPSFLKMKPAI